MNKNLFKLNILLETIELGIWLMNNSRIGSFNIILLSVYFSFTFSVFILWYIVHASPFQNGVWTTVRTLMKFAKTKIHLEFDWIDNYHENKNKNQNKQLSLIVKCVSFPLCLIHFVLVFFEFLFFHRKIFNLKINS